MRFDDLVRSERYFTATLLPAILFHANLRGLDHFLALVEARAVLRQGQPTERDRRGRLAPRSKRMVHWSLDSVEIITEFHIARDLMFAGTLKTATQSAYEAESGADESGPERRDAPDLVIVLDDELVVCEGKFFDDYDQAALDAQLRSQRRQVRHLLALRQDVRAYRHVAILPVAVATPLDCDVTLTWSEIADLSGAVLGSSHYVTQRLRAAVGHYQALTAKVGVKNYESRLPLDAVLAACRVQGDAIHVGHSGGEPDLLTRPLASLEKKLWKLRDPRTNAGVALRKNWIRGTRFLALIEQRRRQAAEADQTDAGSGV